MTDAGNLVRRHRLLETFLVEELDVPWEEVRAEADALERVVSERLMARIDRHLGFRRRGLVPAAGCGPCESWGVRLDRAPAGHRFRIERIHDRDDAALCYLADLGLRPGVTIDVTERAPFGGPLWIRVEKRTHPLSERLTRLVHGQLTTRS